MRFPCQEIALATRGRIVAGEALRAAEGASIDSRTCAPDEAFFAIRGEVHDGHRFVAQAAAAGAACIVVSDASAASGLPASVTVVLVEDTLRALQDLAAAERARSGALTCAISGSAGKTTTKDLAGLLMAGEKRTHATPGNLNNHYGLPLAILRAPAGTEVLVLEMGISTPGEMDRLVEIARPDLGLLTILSPVHVGNFDGFGRLCEEKMKLPRGSRRAVLNADDPEQAARAGSVQAPISWYGEDARAEAGLRLAGVASRGLLGSAVTLCEEGVSRRLELPLPGAHNARNLAAACALARAAGISWDAIARQAALAAPASHRGQVIRRGGVVIVDDTYNANPVAMRAALDLLAEVEGATRRLFVAGDMLELGDAAEREHRELGEHASPRVDVLAAVGPLARHVAEGASRAGGSAVTLDDAESASRWLRATLRPGDVVLLKGSRGIGLDRAVSDLLAEPAGRTP